MTNKLEQLRKFTVVVADTGDVASMKQFKPQDATTNPSLILQASQLPEYAHLVKEAVEYAESQDPALFDENALDYLSVLIGFEISKIVPGYVSTEVDCRESYNLENTLKRARKLISLYEKLGLSKDRVLLKIASTWEGIKAAEILEKEGIHTNLTLLFSFAQARACAEANVTLISPFVGRILDYYKSVNPNADYSGAKDPGVVSVTRIYEYYKTYGYKTIIMGASFRSVEEIKELSGCDRLTIGPALLAQLEKEEGELVRKLTDNYEVKERPAPMSQAEFNWEHNQDTMAIVKLAEGIFKFAADTEKLLEKLRSLRTK